MFDSPPEPVCQSLARIGHRRKHCTSPGSLDQPDLRHAARSDDLSMHHVQTSRCLSRNVGSAPHTHSTGEAGAVEIV